MEHEVSTEPKRRITPEEYLELDSKSERRSEYLDGEMFLMSGATVQHIQITRNITVELTLQMRGGRCQVFPIDLRAKVNATGLYTYADISAVCGEPEFEDDRFYTLLNPILIVEVLSSSTESYDRGKKFAHYRSLASLQEYVLVSQWEYQIERYSRNADGAWLCTEAAGAEASIELPSIHCRLSLSSVYDKVNFERARSRDSIR
jgi:Uma2 family endonuclease